MCVCVCVSICKRAKRDLRKQALRVPLEKTPRNTHTETHTLTFHSSITPLFVTVLISWQLRIPFHRYVGSHISLTALVHKLERHKEEEDSVCVCLCVYVLGARKGG